MGKEAPCFHFYCGDLWNDNNFKLCSWQAQNLWIRMLLLLHSHTPRGEFSLPNGAPMNDDQIAKLCEMPTKSFVELRSELETNHVFSRNGGSIANRRMIKEREMSQQRADSGRMGAAARWQNDANSIASIPSSSGSSSSKKKMKSPALSDSEWIESLKNNPLFETLDIDFQVKKAQAWLFANAPQRSFTRRYFGNWLMRALSDKPLQLAAPQGRISSKVGGL